MSDEALPRYSWGKVPTGMFTRTQLGERGLKPGGPARAHLYLKGRHRSVELYPLAEAAQKRQSSAAQLEVLRRGREAQQAAREAIEAARLRAREQRWEEAEQWRQQREEELREQIDSDHRAAAAEARAWLQLGDGAVILDTETTDLEGDAVEVGVVSLSGTVLFSSLVRPRKPISEGARRCHGISDAEVADAPIFAELWQRLKHVIGDRLVLAYNASFDRGVLAHEVCHLRLQEVTDPKERRRIWPEGDELDPCLARKRWRCAMELFAHFVGDWSRRHGSYTWQPLPGAGHRAVGDCRATLALLQSMAADVPQPLATVERQEVLQHVG